ncbi:MAG: hypothetical protein LBF05_00115 [Tannerella sp.]|jgi:uncharacterized protein YqgQ|nr:hypothetical protein [Tannerella sp.]
MNYIKSYCRIVPGRVILNGEIYFESGSKPYAMQDFLSAVYDGLGVEYRKFYKMDTLSKLGFLASELILDGIDREKPKEDMGIAFFNRSASLEADHRYQQTIRDKNDFFPSPADFVYTLPNIVTGELAIRNKIYGETTFYIIPDFRCDCVCEAIDTMIRYGGMKYVLGGWTEVDMISGGLSCLMVLCRAEDAYFGKKDLMIPLTDDHLDELYNKYEL